MEENNAGVNVTITVTGGNTTIAPVAKVASQTVINIGGEEQVQTAIIAAEKLKTAEMRQEEQPSIPFEKTDDAIRLRKYCDNDESWNKYLHEIRTSKSATDLAKIIVMMAQTEDNLLKDDTTKQSFLEVVMPLAVSIEKGCTLSNIRQRIYDAQQRNKNKK